MTQPIGFTQSAHSSTEIASTAARLENVRTCPAWRTMRGTTRQPAVKARA